MYCAGVFASIEIVEILFELTREYEDWDLDEIIAAVPALAIVATWFAARRWREVRTVNGMLEATVGKLEDALEQRRAMEAQLREAYKTAAMGTLGGGFAGELKGVLDPIRTLAEEGASSASNSDDEKSRLQRIARHAQGGTDIVARMLAFGDGGMREPEVIVAAEGVNESFGLARDALDADLEVECQGDDTAAIRVNRAELHEVVRQLASNAVDAMGAGGSMRVRLDRAEVDANAAREQGLGVGDHVRITIEDSGPGIPPGLASPVFEPFFTTKGAGDGKGLGLAIAYSLVRGWNGNLSVQAAPDGGASFEILVPESASRST